MKNEEMYKIKKTVNLTGNICYMLIKADLVGFTSEKNKKILELDQDEYDKIKNFVEEMAEDLGGFK